jgi:hypothetical protein
VEWLEGLEDEGIARPRALEERPELFPHLDMVWQAFFDASNARQIGFGGVGGLPPSEIEAEIRRFRIESWEEQEDFRFLLRALDNEYLAYQAEKAPKT